MKFDRILSGILMAGTIVTLSACQDDVSPIGPSLTEGEVTIVMDSTFSITAESIDNPVFDSRAASTMLGYINIPEYGELKSSYVAQLMCATELQIPDSIGVERVDSIKMILTVARDGYTGDSLAPQQAKLYNLTRQLPSDIKSNFDPTGYYNPRAAVATKNYTVLPAGANDTILQSTDDLQIRLSLPNQLAKDVYTAYKTNQALFAWPQTFAQAFPGIYVESSFGRGCIVNVKKTSFNVYYHYKALSYVLEDGVTKVKEINKADSVTPFAVMPEVLSSNNISYKPAESIRELAASGKPILITPGGYNVRVRIPMREVIRRFKEDKSSMTVLNSLSLSLPASTIRNSYGLDKAPMLMLIRESDAEQFFKDCKVPDNKTSFYTSYSTSTGSYEFSQLRSYMQYLIDSDQDMTEKDEEFLLIPVDLATTEYYQQTYVTKCSLYFSKPTMTLFNMGGAKLKLTYSKQYIP